MKLLREDYEEYISPKTREELNRIKNSIKAILESVEDADWDDVYFELVGYLGELRENYIFPENDM